MIHPLVESMFDEIKRQGMSVSRVCNESDIDNHLASRWKHGVNTPTIGSLERMLETLGLRLTVVPRDIITDHEAIASVRLAAASILSVLDEADQLH